MRRGAIRAALGLALLLCACQSHKLVGQVEDNFGFPIKGAHVGIEGTRHIATTDAAGRFKLPLPTGERRVGIHAVSFVAQYVAVKAPPGADYSLGAIVMLKVPTNDGLEVQSLHGYVPVDRAAFAADKPAGAPPSCRERRLPRHIPTCAGRTFVAFAPAPPQDNLVLVRAKGNAVWSSGCRGGRPDLVSELKQEKMSAQVILSGKLEPGVYCLTEAVASVPDLLLGETGACFRWSGETIGAPPDSSPAVP